jgi:hypothetical protein
MRLQRARVCAWQGTRSRNQSRSLPGVPQSRRVRDTVDLARTHTTRKTSASRTKPCTSGAALLQCLYRKIGLCEDARHAHAIVALCLDVSPSGKIWRPPSSRAGTWRCAAASERRPFTVANLLPLIPRSQHWPVEMAAVFPPESRAGRFVGRQSPDRDSGDARRPGARAPAIHRCKSSSANSRKSAWLSARTSQQTLPRIPQIRSAGKGP